MIGRRRNTSGRRPVSTSGLALEHCRAECLHGLLGDRICRGKVENRKGVRVLASAMGRRVSGCGERGGCEEERRSAQRGEESAADARFASMPSLSASSSSLASRFDEEVGEE